MKAGILIITAVKSIKYSCIKTVWSYILIKKTHTLKVSQKKKLREICYVFNKI